MYLQSSFELFFKNIFIMYIISFLFFFISIVLLYLSLFPFGSRCTYIFSLSLFDFRLCSLPSAVYILRLSSPFLLFISLYLHFIICSYASDLSLSFPYPSICLASLCSFVYNHRHFYINFHVYFNIHVY